MCVCVCVCVCVCLVFQSCLTLHDPIDCSLPGSSVHGASPGRNTGVGCHSLFHRIFQNQGSNSCLLLCRWILYNLSHREAPKIKGNDAKQNVRCRKKLGASKTVKITLVVLSLMYVGVIYMKNVAQRMSIIYCMYLQQDFFILGTRLRVL